LPEITITKTFGIRTNCICPNCKLTALWDLDSILNTKKEKKKNDKNYLRLEISIFWSESIACAQEVSAFGFNQKKKKKAFWPNKELIYDPHVVA